MGNDRDCIIIDECVLEIDNCDENAACSDTEGSFTCECNQGSLDDEWWGKGVVGNRGAPGCFSCTKCQAGFHEVQPCTSTTDRICRRDIPATVLERSFFDYNNGGGRFTIESEADENRQCLTIQKGDWYPSRLNLGNQAVWRITPLKLNDRKFIIQSSAHGVRDQDGQLSFECLAFEKNGAATNPSRYNWGNGDAWCGAGDWEGQGKDIALLNNKQAVFIIIARK